MVVKGVHRKYLNITGIYGICLGILDEFTIPASRFQMRRSMSEVDWLSFNSSGYMYLQNHTRYFQYTARI